MVGRVRTPVALWTIISALTPEAIAHLGAYSSTIFAAPSGQHSMLRSFQRLAERSDLEFDTSLPVILWRPPSSLDVSWGPEQYFSASLSVDRPDYTAWGTRQTDYRRNWIVYTADESTVGVHGHIQKANLSVAPKALSPEGEIYLNADGTPNYAASDAYIVETIKAQNTAAALLEADSESAAVNVLWVAGARFGIDWSLGTKVSLEVKPGVVSTAPPVARSVAIGLADGAWSFTVGLGPKVAVVPIFRAEREHVSSGGASTAVPSIVSGVDVGGPPAAPPPVGGGEVEDDRLSGPERDPGNRGQYGPEAVEELANAGLPSWYGDPGGAGTSGVGGEGSEGWRGRLQLERRAEEERLKREGAEGWRGRLRVDEAAKRARDERNMQNDPDLHRFRKDRRDATRRDRQPARGGQTGALFRSDTPGLAKAMGTTEIPRQTPQPRRSDTPGLAKAMGTTQVPGQTARGGQTGSLFPPGFNFGRKRTASERIADARRRGVR